MAYKVFISHSTQDQNLVILLSRTLVKWGLAPYVAEWYITPGQQIERKVKTELEKADCIIALLTKNGARSSWVNQEIGIALSRNKLLIPLVEIGTPPSLLGSLVNREYIAFDSHLPQMALEKAALFVNSLRLKKSDREKALLVTGGIVAFLLLLMRSKE